MTTPDVLILFAGAADGWGLGLRRCGYRIAALAESEPARRDALRHHHPEATIYDDVRAVTRERLLADLGRVPAVVVGSPPCQDISYANNGRARGVDGERSGLFFDAVRIIGEVRPDWYALENSPALRTRGFDRVADALEALDYECWPQVVGAVEAGYFHLRRRSWLAGVPSAYAHGVFGRSGRPAWKRFADAQGRDPAHADPERELQLQGRVRSLGRRPRHGGEPAAADAAGVGRQRVGRPEAGGRASEDEPGLPDGLAAIEHAARAFGLAGRSRLAEHYRMADGVPAGLARACISAYGDALVPDIAEAFGRVMPRLLAELVG